MSARVVTPAAALVVALTASGCGPERFLAVDTGVQDDLRGVHAVGPDRFLVAGAAGRIMAWEDRIFTDTSTDADPGPRVPGFYDITSVGGRGVVVGDQGLVLRAEGKEWLEEASGVQDRLLTAFRATPTILYAGGEAGRVVRWTSGEDRWRRVNVGAGQAKITGGWAQSDQAVVLTTDQGAVIERVGEDWITQIVITETSSVPLPLFGAWTATAGADLWAVGLGGSIYRRPAGDEAWVQEEVDVQQDLYSVWGAAADDVFAVGARGTVLHFDGTAWKGLPSSTARDLFSVVGSTDGATVVAVGSEGAMVVLRR
ncbi:MAG: hypothetical protein KC933_08850 [Myxococcales bacterium]|nr:hypothetical protein [Myxococcales bacterium]MCB9645687.1 hypothetical protein [Deltaproteobacteria bacterium]